MAQDKKLTKDTWLNLSTDQGLAANVEIVVQNTGSSNVRVETSIAEPASEDFGLLAKPFESVKASPTGGEFVWVLSVVQDGIVQPQF